MTHGRSLDQTLRFLTARRQVGAINAAARLNLLTRRSHWRNRVKRILSTAVALAAVVLLPIAAQATTSLTIHLNGAPIDVGPAGCVAGDLVIAGNGVLHTTTNNAGDSWTTGTVEGSVTASDLSSGFTGHGVAWFGVEQNRSSFVTHFIADSVGTLGNGTPLRIHQEGQFTINAQGMPVVTRVTVTCS